MELARHPERTRDLSLNVLLDGARLCKPENRLHLSCGAFHHTRADLFHGTTFLTQHNYTILSANMQVSRTGLYLLSILALCVLNIPIYRGVLAEGEIRVSTLAAGKGSVVLLEGPGKSVVLVGSGSDASILRALGQTLPPWSRSIDALILTDTTLEQTGGAPAILERYRVEYVVRPTSKGAPTREAALAEAASLEEGLALVAIDTGRFNLGHGAYLDIKEKSAFLRYGSLTLELSSTTPGGVYGAR